MYFNIYKTTFKNLFRSITFWIALAVVAISVFYDSVINVAYGVFDINYGEMIWDNDPRFVLEYKSYIQQIINSLDSLIRTTMSIFTVITTVLVLNRDYNDKFFEIEKSSGLKPFRYLWGRLSALISLNFILLITFHFISLQLYVYTRGGVSGMELSDYLIDSITRSIRLDFIMGLPSTIFYIVFTYCIGCIFKNSIPAAIGGMGYTIATYLLKTMFTGRGGESLTLYLNYFHPQPDNVFFYMYHYDTEWFDELIQIYKVTPTDVSISIGIIVFAILIYSLLSYLRIRKRTV